MVKNRILSTLRVFLLIWVAFGCSKDQNRFLPYTRVYLQISLVNYNHLKIPGNSIWYQDQGYRGLIVVCVNPDLAQYVAYDACCPYEKDYSGIVEVQPIKNLTAPPYMVFSSDFYGVCNKCGSQFNLLGSGQPVKGPATHYLQHYNVVTGFESLTVTN